MKKKEISAYEIAQRFVGIQEVLGSTANPQILRGGGDQPGPETIDAPGHVGFYAGIEGDNILTLGGNQSDSVGISSYPVDRMLGIRRLS